MHRADGMGVCSNLKKTGDEEMDIDLSTKQEIKLRFNQLCAYFAIQVRDKTEPQDVYIELYCIANALKDKYCHEPT